MNDPISFANNVRNVYNIENDKNYWKVVGRGAASNQTEYVEANTLPLQRDMRVYVNETGNGEKLIDFCYNKMPVRDAENPDKHYKFSQDGNVCQYQDSERCVLVEFDGPDIGMGELTQDGTNYYYYDYDDNGQLLESNTRQYRSDSFEEHNIKYENNNKRTETTTKKTLNEDSEDLSDNHAGRYKLDYKCEEKYENDRLSSRTQDTDGNGDYDIEENFYYNSDGRLWQKTYKDINNPKENHTTSTIVKDGKIYGYDIYENDSSKDIYTTQYMTEDGKIVTQIDYKNNDMQNPFQMFNNWIKKLCGDYSGYDKIITQDPKTGKTEYKYEYCK